MTKQISIRGKANHARAMAALIEGFGLPHDVFKGCPKKIIITGVNARARVQSVLAKALATEPQQSSISEQVSAMQARIERVRQVLTKLHNADQPVPIKKVVANEFFRKEYT